MKLPARTAPRYLGMAVVIAAVLLLPLPGAPFGGSAHGASIHAPAYPASPITVPHAPAGAPPGQASLRMPITSAPPPPTPGWHATATGAGPSVRGSTAMASSPVENVTLLFSGSHPSATVDNETWELANGAWTDLTPTLATSPGPAADAGLVWDGADGYFLLFGGLPSFGGTASNQTWTFQNGTWTNLTGNTTATPPARFGASMAYDARDGYVVLFGGYGVYNQPLNDTWTYRAGTWTALSPAASPSPRAYSATTYDERLGGVIVYGGQVYNAFTVLNDTWEFAAGGWTNLTGSSGPAPPARRGPTMSYDPSYGADVLFGGNNYSWGITYNDTWLLVAGHWRDITANVSAAPAARFLAVSAFDPTTDAVVLFGGCTAAGCATALNDTERYVFDLGSARLSPSTTLLDVNATVRLTASAEGGSFEYSYAYSGLPSSCPTANRSVLVCVPNAPGNYTPSVAITDVFTGSGAGPSQVNATSVRIEVLPPLVVAAVASRASLDVGQTVWINVSASGSASTHTVSYTGLPTGCASANVTALACAPLVAGAASVTASVRDGAGGLSSATVSFNVLPRLVASVHASAAESEVGQTVGFTASATGGTGTTGFAWPSLPPGCGVVAARSVNCTPALAGTLNVSVVANDSNGGSAVGDSGPVLIVARLAATAGAAPSSGVAPLTVSFTSSIHGGIAPFSVLWEFGDGASATASNASHTYSTLGSYTVRLGIEDAAGVWSNETLVVSVAPRPGVLVAASPAAVDVGQSTTLSAVPSNLSGPVTYTWMNLPRGCAAENASSLVCAPALSGNYSIRVVASNASGESAASGTYLLVYPPVFVSIATSGPSGCACACGPSLPVAFTPTVGGGAPPYRYHWDFGDGTSASTAGPGHNYTATPGGASFTVNLTVNDSLGERVSALATVAVPPSSCGTSSGGSASTVPWSYVAVAVVAIAAVGAAAFAILRRRAPPRGPPTASPGLDDADPSGAMEPPADEPPE